jgi:hypothetical protein
MTFLAHLESSMDIDDEILGALILICCWVFAVFFLATVARARALSRQAPWIRTPTDE